MKKVGERLERAYQVFEGDVMIRIYLIFKCFFKIQNKNIP